MLDIFIFSPFSFFFLILGCPMLSTGDLPFAPQLQDLTIIGNV